MSWDVEPCLVLFEDSLECDRSKIGYPGHTTVFHDIVLRPRKTPLRAAIPPNWLIVDTSCAPIDTSKRRRESRKEKIGVMLPLKRRKRRPRKRIGLRGTVG